MTILEYLISFFVFIILQSLFINGVKDLFGEGMILYKFRKFIDNNVKDFWRKPIYSCTKCMSSLYGAITFFPTVIYLFGFRWEEIPVLIFDVCILVYTNYFFYKRA